jgi:hypothetical protein
MRKYLFKRRQKDLTALNAYVRRMPEKRLVIHRVYARRKCRENNMRKGWWRV